MISEQQKLLEALKTIKETCANHERCVNCPIFSDHEGGCAFEGSPNNLILTNEPGPWRAVK